MEVSSCPTLPLSWVPNCPVPNCPVSKCPVPSCPVSSCPGFVLGAGSWCCHIDWRRTSQVWFPTYPRDTSYDTALFLRPVLLQTM